MKYKNASDIFPDRLLREIQQYVSGEPIYIPSGKERKKWGEGSGARMFYQERNEEIRLKYFNKASIEVLADEYNLSTDTIRKIVFK